jgi:hypothetical protein
MREAGEAVSQYGTVTEAAKATGIPRSTLDHRYQQWRRKVRQGYSPEHDMHHPAPDGFKVKGVSTYYNDEGQPVGQWVKTTAVADEMESLRAFAESLQGEIEPAKPRPLPASRRHTPDLMTGIFIGDAHIGMRAYGRETKHHDFDTDIATAQLRDAIDTWWPRLNPRKPGCWSTWATSCTPTGRATRPTAARRWMWTPASTRRCARPGWSCAT